MIPMARDSLTEITLARAAKTLARRDGDLAAILESYGSPPLWARPPGFATLVRIILEQQVSLASARAAFLRLQAGAGRMAAGRLARLSPARIMKFGITRQKARFIHELAVQICAGGLKLRGLAASDDVTVRRTLI